MQNQNPTKNTGNEGKKQITTTTCWIATLPTELQISILDEIQVTKDLVQIRTVCKQFNLLILDLVEKRVYRILNHVGHNSPSARSGCYMNVVYEEEEEEEEKDEIQKEMMEGNEGEREAQQDGESIITSSSRTKTTGIKKRVVDKVYLLKLIEFSLFRCKFVIVDPLMVAENRTIEDTSLGHASEPNDSITDSGEQQQQQQPPPIPMREWLESAPTKDLVLYTEFQVMFSILLAGDNDKLTAARSIQQSDLWFRPKFAPYYSDDEDNSNSNKSMAAEALKKTKNGWEWRGEVREGGWIPCYDKGPATIRLGGGVLNIEHELVPIEKENDEKSTVTTSSKRPLSGSSSTVNVGFKFRQVFVQSDFILQFLRDQEPEMQAARVVNLRLSSSPTSNRK